LTVHGRLHSKRCHRRRMLHHGAVVIQGAGRHKAERVRVVRRDDRLADCRGVREEGGPLHRFVVHRRGRFGVDRG